MFTMFPLLRECLPFAIVLAGIILALFGAYQFTTQRREKAQKLLEKFKGTLHAHDLAHWHELFAGTSESVFAPAGHFIGHEGKPVPLDSMWTAGSEDHTAIQRMAENFEKICQEILTETVDIKMVWFEIGHLMSEMHKWLGDIQGVSEERTFLEEQYPSIKEVFEKYQHEFKKWPYRSFE